MAFYAQIAESSPCPDCCGTGRQSRYAYYVACLGCDGIGQLKQIVLTYPEYLTTGGQPAGQTFYGGHIQEPDYGSKN